MFDLYLKTVGVSEAQKKKKKKIKEFSLRLYDSPLQLRASLIIRVAACSGHLEVSLGGKEAFLLREKRDI